MSKKKELLKEIREMRRKTSYTPSPAPSVTAPQAPPPPSPPQQQQQRRPPTEREERDEDGECWVVIDEEDDGVPQPAPTAAEERVFDEILGCGVIDVERLRRLSFRCGVPPKIRSTVWRVLTGYLPPRTSDWSSCLALSRAKYSELAAAYDLSLASFDGWEGPRRTLFNEIRVDLPRTILPGFAAFCGLGDVQRMLGRILFLWSVNTPTVSYFQGQLDLTYLFLLCFLSEHPSISGDFRKLAKTQVVKALPQDFVREIEADVFWCLSRLMTQMETSFTKDFMSGVDAMLEEMSRIVSIGDDATWGSLLSKDCRLPDFAFRWMICLLVREFKVPRTMRLWDSYFSIWSLFPLFHIYVCAALVLTFGARLQKLDFFELVNFMQHLPVEHWTDRDIEALESRALDLLERDVRSDSTMPPTPRASLVRRRSGNIGSALIPAIRAFAKMQLPGSMTMERAVALVVYVIVIAVACIVLAAALFSLVSGQHPAIK